MHRLEGEYGDYSGGAGCSVVVRGGEPYLLLNLEMLFELCKGVHGSHSDFVYVMRDRDGTFNVFVVELKGGLVRNGSLAEKFRNSLNAIRDLIVKHFNISGHVNYYAVLALPLSHDEQVRKIQSLLKHLKKDYQWLQRVGFRKGWITMCGSEIYHEVFRLFPLEDVQR